MINGKFVLDAHCHIYPDAIAAKAAKAIGTFSGQPSACGGTAEELVRVHNEAGIDFALVQSAATVPHQVESINAFIAANSSSVSVGNPTIISVVIPAFGNAS